MYPVRKLFNLLYFSRGRFVLLGAIKTLEYTTDASEIIYVFYLYICVVNIYV